MGVYIKGMEMPTSCESCMFSRRSIHNIDWCVLTEKDLPSDCPLVPVPPHGRLIDADALRQSIKESIDECHKWADEVEGGEMYARVSQSLGLCKRGGNTV